MNEIASGLLVWREDVVDLPFAWVSRVPRVSSDLRVSSGRRISSDPRISRVQRVSREGLWLSLQSTEKLASCGKLLEEEGEELECGLSRAWVYQGQEELSFSGLISFLEGGKYPDEILALENLFLALIIF